MGTNNAESWSSSFLIEIKLFSEPQLIRETLIRVASNKTMVDVMRIEFTNTDSSKQITMIRYNLLYEAGFLVNLSQLNRMISALKY